MRIFGAGWEFLRQDENFWDRIRIFGTGWKFLGQDENFWDRMRIFGTGWEFSRHTKKSEKVWGNIGYTLFKWKNLALYLTPKIIYEEINQIESKYEIFWSKC